ncbi:hypothetical protein Desmer_3368 [Desulfosporosinus meridiei DSM 13257]|uniref:Uncharacterized protein n=1 Tax=Desulfosporosinus meridiei (strain ATCC BAA-275 / DSM 13257 / KCTC 12902 / NCIMB 13706 / S10) TaxID=768704 RepID=J7IYL2_DESMD|nr:hypothetical protein Desmer_3368 [Desulfosporosinus meridiei DSM 13257]
MYKDKHLSGFVEEEKFMATAIAPTPILKGQDLVKLVTDLKKPDNNKDMRQKALKALLSISK